MGSEAGSILLGGVRDNIEGKTDAHVTLGTTGRGTHPEHAQHPGLGLMSLPAGIAVIPFLSSLGTHAPPAAWFM